ncbi:uncharacterized membrane protein YcaP (DUF421 family) [Bacillus mesophilus]|uniref:DUF421 domain-containing protein n=1 Tax=Bacillus mesophilus TaxID=1808955 RepID=A0A6M0Q3I0_9BACI|nr:DUF421 domain-containing protein [Bacillus mesophilus]MBM7660218.1 uncharacterized membrane protein YcaP (DUF421 family) [Bacillus mesophilus]NEY70936.1 DUF421 domain-containing protein [Bacillus mesophilus]
MTYIEMIVRCLLIFAVLYTMCRILGKKLISQMTFFDFVAGITLGSIAGAFMFSQGVPKSVGIVGLVLFAILALLVDYIALKSFKARKILNDEPTLVVKNGKIHEEGMAKSRLSVDELLFQLRKKNIFYVDQVDIAFFETDGSVSALKRVGELPPTKTELQINTPSRGVPQTFIIDGKILENSLASINKDHSWVEFILKSKGVSMKEVFIAQIDENNTIYIDKRSDQQSL